LSNRTDETDATCITHGYMQSTYKILAGKPRGKRPLRRPIRRWDNNII